MSSSRPSSLSAASACARAASVPGSATAAAHSASRLRPAHSSNGSPSTRMSASASLACARAVLERALVQRGSGRARSAGGRAPPTARPAGRRARRAAGAARPRRARARTRCWRRGRSARGARPASARAPSASSSVARAPSGFPDALCASASATWIRVRRSRCAVRDQPERRRLEARRRGRRRAVELARGVSSSREGRLVAGLAPRARRGAPGPRCRPRAARARRPRARARRVASHRARPRRRRGGRPGWRNANRRGAPAGRTSVRASRSSSALSASCSGSSATSAASAGSNGSPTTAAASSTRRASGAELRELGLERQRDRLRHGRQGGSDPPWRSRGRRHARAARGRTGCRRCAVDRATSPPTSSAASASLSGVEREPGDALVATGGRQRGRSTAAASGPRAPPAPAGPRRRAAAGRARRARRSSRGRPSGGRRARARAGAGRRGASSRSRSARCTRWRSAATGSPSAGRTAASAPDPRARAG